MCVLSVLLRGFFVAQRVRACVRACETFPPVRSSLETSSGCVSPDSQLPSVLSACVPITNWIFPREWSTAAAGADAGACGGRAHRVGCTCSAIRLCARLHNCEAGSSARPSADPHLERHGTLGSHSRRTGLANKMNSTINSTVPTVSALVLCNTRPPSEPGTCMDGSEIGPGGARGEEVWAEPSGGGAVRVGALRLT